LLDLRGRCGWGGLHLHLIRSVLGRTSAVKRCGAANLGHGLGDHSELHQTEDPAEKEKQKQRVEEEKK